jgi:hypothetical protein
MLTLAFLIVQFSFLRVFFLFLEERLLDSRIKRSLSKNLAALYGLPLPV